MVEGNPKLSIPSGQPAAGPVLPVTWSDLDDDGQLWSWDQMHFPNAITPLTASIEGPAFEMGFNAAAEAFAKPFAGIQVRFFHHYWYQRVLPFTGDQVARTRRRVQILAKHMPHTQEDFVSHYLPEIQRINQSLQNFAYESASLDELLAFFRVACGMRMRIWVIHFLALYPATEAADQLIDLYQQLFGNENPQAPLEMLQGFPNKTIETSQRLWELAHIIATDVALNAKLRRLDPAAWPRACQDSPAGRAFLDRVDTFLQECGWTVEGGDYHETPWIEDPRPVWRALRVMLNEGVTAPAELQQASVTRRLAVTQATLGRLKGHRQEAAFHQSLKAAEQLLPLMEDHNYFIDQANTSLMRRPAIAVGETLARVGQLAQPTDVFFLTAEEVMEVSTRQTRDLVRRAEHRREDWELWRQITPPAQLGPAEAVSATGSQTGRFFGPATATPPEAKLLRGRPASGGRAQGKARIMRDLSAMSEFRSGEILVCRTSTPLLAPLFAAAAAVVTDMGGELSHSAIVAREYGIPCVTGTGQATDLIQTGQEVSVDGYAGTVAFEPIR